MSGRYLALVLAAVGLPEPQEEYMFHPKRKWRFDLAWPEHRLAVEIEGGIWLQTSEGRSKGHANPKRFLDDIEKYNEAALAGFRLIRVTPEMVGDGQALALIERAFNAQASQTPNPLPVF